ncbi:MAG: hypothetical protein IJW92_08215 [Clostridia bacterium]|nr:hypothetical protein [Clostridia bacterium]
MLNKLFLPRLVRGFAFVDPKAVLVKKNDMILWVHNILGLHFILEMGLRHWRSPCSKKPMVGFFDARNLRFWPEKRAKMMAFSHQAKTTGVSTKCIFAFNSPPF